MKKRKIRHSLKRQFAFTFISLMAGTIFLCGFINNTFLERYYEKYRTKDLLTGYNKIEAAAMNGNLTSESFHVELSQMYSRENISGIIMDAGTSVLVFFGDDSDKLQRQLKDNIYSNLTQNSTIIKTTDNYVMQKMYDAVTRSEYMEIWGMLESGTIFLLRTPLANITDSVEIANQFLIYIGVAGIFISSIIIWVVTRKITEPILELVDISERMIHLDFEAKYTGGNKTEISLLGDNINKLSETLETTISELKTANNELRKDIELKNKMDTMRTEFLANVSHELKTPIALIQGYAEGLLEGINEDASSKTFYCEVIVDEAAKMNNLVKGLMNLNQLEYGYDVITMERFDIVALITNYLQSAQILIKQSEASVRMEHYDSICVWADEFKTEEVFMNYFTNALNHVSGEKIIDINLEQIDGKVRVYVFNTGEPLPEESLEFIWDKFYKVDKARTRSYGGSGVGLSVVKAIMESMNQQYGVINYQNGVAFWFELETVSCSANLDV